MNATMRDALRDPAAVGLTAAVVYAMTAARDPQFGDGLEFLAAAAVRGVPHPTGYPTFTLLLSPLASGPNAYFHAALLCAAFAVGVAVLVCLLTRALLHDLKPPETLGLQRWLPLVAGLVTALTCSLWSAATVVESYGLHALFAAALLVLLVPRPNEPVSCGRLVAATLLQALALTNHVTALAYAPLLLWRVVQHLRANPKKAMVVPFALIAVGLVGLTPYLLLPWWASSSPPINWGNPTNLERFLWVVSGGDYKHAWLLKESPGIAFTFKGWLLFAVSRMLQLLSAAGSELLGGREFVTTTARLWVSVVLGLGLLGVFGWGKLVAWRMSRVWAAVLVLVPAAPLAFVYLYNIRDIEDYFLGLWIACAPLLLIGAIDLIRRAAVALAYVDDPLRARRLLIPGIALVLLPLGTNWKTADLSQNNYARVWIDRLMEALPQDAVLLTAGDVDTYGAWYAQYVEGTRPDVFVAAGGFLRLEWYDAMVPTNDPLGRTARAEPGDFRSFTIESHADMLVRNVIAPNLGRAPVVMTAFPAPHPGAESLSRVLSRRVRVEPLALLVAPDEVEAFLENVSLVPPFLLEELTPLEVTTPPPGAPG